MSSPIARTVATQIPDGAATLHSSPTACPSSATASGDVLLMHDGHAARTPSGQPVLLAVLPRLLDTLLAQGLRSVPLAEAVPETTSLQWQGVTA